MIVFFVILLIAVPVFIVWRLKENTSMGVVFSLLAITVSWALMLLFNWLDYDLRIGSENPVSIEAYSFLQDRIQYMGWFVFGVYYLICYSLTMFVKSLSHHIKKLNEDDA